MEKFLAHWADDQRVTGGADWASSTDTLAPLDAGLNAAASVFEALPQRSPPPPATPDSWKSAVSGNWTTAADWSAGVPTSSNDVTIAVSGKYTVTINSADAANSLTINDATATVSDTSGGTLSITTTLAVTAGTFSLGSGSEISGGTISLGSSGVFLASGGTLSGVSYQGTLGLTGASSSLYLAGNDTFAGTGGTGAGVINLTGSGANLYVEETTRR
jgi:hypothetical protein